MPVIGVLAGRALGGVFGTVANYLGIGLVALVGLWMLFGPEEGERSRADGLSSGRGLSAVALGLSVSLDELAMGFSIGLLRLPVVLAVIIIGAQAFLAAQIGLRLGARGGERLREGAERGAGLALLALGALLLVQQLTR
jgi:putative Mn2+ efflux pump MntP